jgi:hypothetical protein
MDKKEKNLRKEFLIDIQKEAFLCEVLAQKLLKEGINASNTVIVTVSTDYSSVIGQFLRHALSYGGEICDGFGIDVPYPDETWTKQYVIDLHSALEANKRLFTNGETLLLVEAGVIRGGNYKFVTDFLDKNIANEYKTSSMFENVGSAFKSDFVAAYYDNEIQDLTFWWEKKNNHWLVNKPNNLESDGFSFETGV